MASVTKRVTATGENRYEVRYRLPTGHERSKTFRRRRDADRFANTAEADKARGGLIDPQAGRLTLAAYATTWLDHRPDLAPRTVELYRSLLRLHIEPTLGEIELGRLDTETIRRWHAARLNAGTGSTTVAKAYRLLRAILNTAAEDGRIIANPCRIKRGGAETAQERPVATSTDVWALADAVPSERRCLVLLAGFCGLRLGEALGLARRHVDLLHGTLTVERQCQEIGTSGAFTFTEPKSAAARRTIPLPASVAGELRSHLEAHGDDDPDALIFTGEKGGPLRRHVWHSQWNEARNATGRPELRYHDLRHSALTMLAATGATVAELQAYAGHSSPDAALRYQHATRDRARALAELVEAAIANPQAAEGATVHAIDR